MAQERLLLANNVDQKQTEQDLRVRLHKEDEKIEKERLESIEKKKKEQEHAEYWRK